MVGGELVGWLLEAGGLVEVGRLRLVDWLMRLVEVGWLFDVG